MRETKHRGKALAPQGMTGNWIYGYHCKVKGRHYIILEDAFIDEDEFGLSSGIEGFVEVDPETVGQSTNRKDKNGKEIYEGDKEVGRDGIQGTVIWLEDDCSFAVEYPGIETQELVGCEDWFEKVVE